ncbi:heme peroxidase [Peziza echinospora]|nr:heme peroxidase [Peziza echinospora]
MAGILPALPDLGSLRTALHTAIQSKTDSEETSFADILEEFKSKGPEFMKHAQLVVDLVNSKTSGLPLDDRDMLTERIIKVVAKLPETSKARKKITEVLVDQLWASLPHPPLTYVGEQFQFRQADGSYNNIMSPDLGKAGTPYARTVRTETQPLGARPDPGQLFDLLMSRGDDYETNPAGISSMLLYHASIITHDIFHTNRQNANISETSSYLDLAPLYGSNQKQQNAVRTFIGGQLKPDTFHERRLLGFPPGVNVMLIMYSRFHNYAARTLEAINEGGRFTPPRHLNAEEGQFWKDEQLFNVARLVVNGLYVNISLHDYLRAIANVPATDSSWTLDPRVAIKKVFSKEGVPTGIGNQVSCEFNLLYRFHSAISDRDTKWTKEFYKTLFPGQDPHNISMPVLFKGLTDFEKSIPSDPSVREFAGLKRQANGTFNDDELVKILKESIEDCAGRFGANHVPDILKPVEILGIIQARKWQVGSLNEFRKFFKLKPYEKFTDINDDPYVAKTLDRLYDGKIDNVEMYPGMFLESCKPRMDAGMGLCAPYTVTRAVFSDAITLVRGDRFLTLDYTPANLTNWGISEAASDLGILGGAKMHTLILNAFPNHFKFDSVYAMQPFYTPAESRKIFDKLGWADLYSWEPPTRSASALIPVTTHAGLKAVLANKGHFKVPWGPKMQALSTYMLAADTDGCAAQRTHVQGLIYCKPSSLPNFALYAEELTMRLIRRDSYALGYKGAQQIDIVKSVANHGATIFAADMFYLPLNAASGPSYTEAELYKVLSDLTTYVFSDADPLRSWRRRKEANAGTSKLVKEMEDIITKLPPDPRISTPAVTTTSTKTSGYVPRTFIGKALLGDGKTTTVSTTAGSDAAEIIPTDGPLGEHGITLARKLRKAGKTPREAAEILVGSACAFVANTATACAQLVDFYLEAANDAHWTEIKRLAPLNTAAADETLNRYVYEGFRLSNSLGLIRVVAPDGDTISIKDGDKPAVTAKKGDRLFISFIAAGRDPKVFPSPNEVRLDRNIDDYITFGDGGHHACLGKDITLAYARTILKTVAKLKNFRRTPGDEGRLKFLPKPGGIKLYLNPEWSDFSPYPTTMKVMFDGAV